jgi:glycosyltransferase involved in cell wall biosynthesis
MLVSQKNSPQRSVLIIAPCWPETGAMNIIVSGLASYATLGWHIHLLLVEMDAPFQLSSIKDQIQRNMPEKGGRLLSVNLLRRHLVDRTYMGIGRPYLISLSERILRAKIPSGVEASLNEMPCSIIHVHHCWNLKLAKRISRLIGGADGKKIKIICETHDIQSQNPDVLARGFWGLLSVFRQQLVAQEEIRLCGIADILIHININDLNYFKDNLPTVPSYLVQPGLLPEIEKSFSRFAKLPLKADGQMIIIAAANYWNVKSIAWFLKNVIPLLGPTTARLAIFGRINSAMKWKHPRQYGAHLSNFKGVIPDPSWAYEQARLVLLPVLGGTGTSIRLIETLCSGCPVVLSSKAARGFESKIMGVEGITVADSASDFANGIKKALGRIPEDERITGAEKIYQKYFSVKARRRELEFIIDNL